MLEKLLLKKASLKILIPTDLSTPQSIVPTLSQLMKKVSMEVTLMHVSPQSWQMFQLKNDHPDNTIPHKLLKLANKLPKGKKKHQLFLCQGAVVDEIIHTSKRLKTDLIVFDEEKEAKTYSNETSTIARQVIRYSNKSVLICKKNKLSKILCAVDGSRSSHKALISAIQLCKLFSCKLIILQVLHQYDFDRRGLEEHVIRKFEEEFKQKCVKKMRAVIKNLDTHLLKSVKNYYIKGTPASTILDIAKDEKIDLIVMGAKGHSLLHDIFIGSTVERTLPFTPCSLLIVR